MAVGKSEGRGVHVADVGGLASAQVVEVELCMDADDAFAKSVMEGRREGVQRRELELEDYGVVAERGQVWMSQRRVRTERVRAGG